jgi:hypothetical protein
VRKQLDAEIERLTLENERKKDQLSTKAPRKELDELLVDA